MEKLRRSKEGNWALKVGSVKTEMPIFKNVILKT